MENWIILLLDLFGTAVFAITGAVQGIRHHLDVFGVTVLACCVGVGGGIVRDCIIGCTPVAALTHQHYIVICIAVGLISYATARFWIRKRNIIKICDAIGLGVFTALGAEKGFAQDLGFTGIILCGTFTAIGGGVYCLLLPFKYPFAINFALVSLLVCSIRLLAIRYNIQLPAAGRLVNRRYRRNR